MAPYPVIAAGQRVTAGLLTAMQDDMIRKLQNTDRITSTMLDDPELVVALEASAVYFVEMFLLLGGNTTGDIRTLWTVPSGATGFKSVMGPASGTTDVNADNIVVRMGVHNFPTIIAYSGVRNATGNMFRVYEHGEVTTTTAGILALNWGQVTTNAGASRVGAGSLMRAKRIG
ncbi:hypothetical protein [Actinomadura sp. 21ATH]|uniref:hypothetical protein n=1 Tax=Actinomadura sp. 21ATH TaxID=1735444 RepID=UPI0035C1FC82